MSWLRDSIRLSVVPQEEIQLARQLLEQITVWQQHVTDLLQSPEAAADQARLRALMRQAQTLEFGVPENSLVRQTIQQHLVQLWLQRARCTPSSCSVVAP